jgi:hypothetical protein
MLVGKMRDSEYPKWLDAVEAGAVGLLTLDDGKRMTAEVVEFDEERDELVVNVISPNHHNSKSDQDRRSIPLGSIVSYEPQLRVAQSWPYSDPCRGRSFSRARFALMTTLFLSWILGSVPLFLLLIKKPYGLQVASMIVYTLYEVFFTFARSGTRSGRDLPPYLFTCPAVEPQIPRLLWRHLGFLVALFAFQTAALAARPSLPEWWNTPDKKGSAPFELALLFLCLGLAFAQMKSNRCLLKRAHEEFSV